MNYLGIDYGTQRIGLALATDETPPVPLAVVDFQQPWSQEILDIIEREQIDVIVIGRPQSMRDTTIKTEIEEGMEAFASILQSQISIPIVYVDERLTSKGADAIKKEFGQSGDRDAVSAMLILESYLEKSKTQIDRLTP